MVILHLRANQVAPRVVTTILLSAIRPVNFAHRLTETRLENLDSALAVDLCRATCAFTIVLRT